jgi:hypothetical protein
MTPFITVLTLSQTKPLMTPFITVLTLSQTYSDDRLSKQRSPCHRDDSLSKQCSPCHRDDSLYNSTHHVTEMTAFITVLTLSQR